ncbi:Dyp-type peroxidase domain-containing protein [Streptomyces sp. NPDC001868]|uniref:Dyp-type peroxidase n=1 Tax=Streptomyces sp. NPDC001868 TaxID=3154401 RepID=UPI0033234EC7
MARPVVSEDVLPQPIALGCVAGIGAEAWDRLFGSPRPAALHPFPELEGPRHRAVSTPGDLLFHIRATRVDPCFAPAAEIMRQLRGVDSWDELPVEAQEKVIGGTKLTNLELDVEGSHVDVDTVLGPDGTEQRILRAAMPFGRPGQGEFGTYFIAYARDPETMLRKMFLGEPPVGHDRILDFSRAVTGTMFFVPSADFLRTIPARRPPV